MADRLARLSAATSQFARWFAGAGLLVMTLIISWQVFARYVLNASPPWAEQASLLLMIWYVLLAAAAGVILGEHEFSAFCVRGTPRPHHRCRVATAQWLPRAEGRGWRFEVAADRFLHHMVRMLVGTMVDIGLGRRPGADMARLLASADNQETSPPAPPEGLYFVAATYDRDDYVHSPGDRPT